MVEHILREDKLMAQLCVRSDTSWSDVGILLPAIGCELSLHPCLLCHSILPALIIASKVGGPSMVCV
jgi:hypothetical protein